MVRLKPVGYLDFFVIAVLIVALGLSTGVYIKFTKLTIPSRPVVDNVRCPPSVNAECHAGIVITAAGGETVCDATHAAVGAACSSPCYSEGTATHCNGDHNCAASNPTSCLGYCTDRGNQAYTDGNSCDGKLAFKDFLTSFGNYSSSDYHNLIGYSDYSPDCLAEGGCTWYSAMLYFYGRNDTRIRRTAATQYTSCLEILNMTNAGCITAQAIVLGENITKNFFTDIATYYTDTEPTTYASSFYFHAIGCVYSYKCGLNNQTFMTNPDILLGSEVKRAASRPVPESRATERLFELIDAHKDKMHRTWASRLDAAVGQKRSYIHVDF